MLGENQILKKQKKMNNFKDNDKILFIPGWLDRGGLHGHKNSLDIWNKKIDLKKDFKADLVITHSLGALAALANWNIHKNFKIIMINPVFSSKNVFSRWLKFMAHEGAGYSFKRTILFFYLVTPAIFKARKLFKVPAAEIIKTIPKDDLIIIHGAKDKYLYDQEFINNFSHNGFDIVEVEGTGHNYNKKIEKQLTEIIQCNI